MTTALPWILIALGAVAAFLHKPASDQKPNWLASGIGLFGLIVILAGGLSEHLFQFQFGPEWIAVLGLLALAGWRPSATAGALGFAGGIVAANPGPVGGHAETLYLHLALLGIGAISLASASSQSAGAAGMVGFAGLAGRYFLLESTSENVKMLPAAIILAAVVVGIAGVFVPQKEEKEPAWRAPAVGALCGVVVAVLTNSLLPDNQMPLVAAVAAVAALATAWAMPNDRDPEPLKVGFAALVWLGIATFAFSHNLTLGMSVALLAGAATLAVTETIVGFAMMAPLFGLIAHRLARNIYPESVRAFDLGQHYAIVGIILAACIVLMLAQAFRRTQMEPQPRIVASAAVGWLLATLAILFSVMFLGAKGSTGLIVGIGLAPLFVQLGKSDGAAGSAIGAGLVGILGLAYPRLAELFEVSRSEKQVAFVIAAIIGLVLAIFLMWLGHKPRENQSSENLSETV